MRKLSKRLYRNGMLRPLVHRDPPALAGVVTFQGATVGSTITSQYAGQGLTFSSGIVDQDYLGGYFLRVSDTTHPSMNLLFSSPIYRFQARLYETTTEFQPSPDQPPETDTAPPGDAPPASDVKPDASIYPTLHVGNGVLVDLPVIHALNEWKALSFESSDPIDGLALLGSYPSGQTPVYFFIDDITFDTTPVNRAPVPATLMLVLSGLAALAVARRRGS